MGFWKRLRIAAGAALRGRKGVRFVAARAFDGLPQIPRDFDALCARAQPKVGRVTDAMHRIVFSAIGAVVVAVGTYHIALLAGASDPAAAAAAAAVAVAVAVAAFAAVAAAVAAAFAAAFAAVAAFAAFAAVAAFAAFAAAAAAVAAFAAVAAAVAADVAKEKQLRIGWPLAAYAMEALTILGALTIGSVSGSIAVVIGGIGSLLILRHMYRRTRTRATATAQDANLPDRVAAFLSGSLTEERNRFLGEGSVFQNIAQRVAQARENAGRIREQVGVRIRRAIESGQQPRTYLTTASDAAQDLCTRLDANRDQLDAYRARVDAFFAECEAHVSRIAEPLRDRALLRELDALMEEGDNLDRNVRKVVEEETAALAHRIAGLRDQLLRLAGDARVQTALAIPERGGMGDIAVFEDALRAFDSLGDTEAQAGAATSRVAQTLHS